jgi:tetratricopeptide (TPR) repeat protein
VPPNLPEVVAVPSPRTFDNKDLLEHSSKLLKDGEGARAVNLLRSAVDAEPLDPERRRALIEALVSTGDSGLAADEARRATLIHPEDVQLWLAGARASIAANRSEDALRFLNEAVAREPNNPGTRMLLGELQLAELKPGFAIEHFDKALLAKPTSSGFFMRGIARLADGKPGEAQKDLDEARRLGGIEVPALEDYRLAMKVSQGLGVRACTGLRDQIPSARLSPQDLAVRTGLASIEKDARSAAAILDAVAPKARHNRSHERRSLALKLLLQAIGDVKAHLAGPNEAILSEAVINLGEAILQLQTAGKDFESELTKTGPA